MDATTIDIEVLQNFTPLDLLSDAVLDDLRSNLSIRDIAKGKILFKRGQKDLFCHFLIDGSIDLADADFTVTALKHDDDENYLAFDNLPTHSVTAITTSAVKIISIEREHLDLVITWAQARESLELHTQQEHSENDWMEALLASDLFAKIPPANIQTLFIRFDEIEVAIGQRIITEGEEGDAFFVIKDGHAIVSLGEGKQQTTLAALQPGDCFGEDALIGGGTRNASITMSTSGTLMQLNKDDFTTLLKDPVIRTIDKDALEHMVEEGDRGTVIIDIRTDLEAKHDHIPGSQNIPLSILRNKIRELSPDFDYVICGDGGGRSELGTYILNEAGFNAYALKQEPAKEMCTEDVE